VEKEETIYLGRIEGEDWVGEVGGCDPLVSEQAQWIAARVRGYRPRFGVAEVSNSAPLAVGNGSSRGPAMGSSRRQPPCRQPPAPRPVRERGEAAEERGGGVARGQGHRHMLPRDGGLWKVCDAVWVWCRQAGRQAGRQERCDKEVEGRHRAKTGRPPTEAAGGSGGRGETEPRPVQPH
jgi:hypothetical protein